MEGSTLRLTRFVGSSELLVYPLYEPSFVEDRHVRRLPPRESSVIHQEECRFEDELLPILRLKAKER
jgi:hypothetical protein